MQPGKRLLLSALMLSGAAPPGRFAAFTATDVGMSVSGASWVMRGHNGGDIRRVVKDPASDRLVALVAGSPNTSATLKYSDDFGVTWSAATHTFATGVGNAGPPGSSLFFLNGYFFAATGTDSASMARSTDGATWTALAAPPAGNVLCPWQGGNKIAAINRSGTSYGSTDNGDTWAAITTNVTAPGRVTALPSGRVVAAAYDNNVAANRGYSDNGTDWYPGTSTQTFQGYGPQELRRSVKFNGVVGLWNSYCGFSLSNAAGTAWTDKQFAVPTTYVPHDFAENSERVVFIAGQRVFVATSADPLTFQTISTTFDINSPIVWHENAE